VLSTQFPKKPSIKVGLRHGGEVDLEQTMAKADLNATAPRIDRWHGHIDLPKLAT